MSPISSHLLQWRTTHYDSGFLPWVFSFLFLFFFSFPYLTSFLRLSVTPTAVCNGSKLSQQLNGVLTCLLTLTAYHINTPATHCTTASPPPTLLWCVRGLDLLAAHRLAERASAAGFARLRQDNAAGTSSKQTKKSPSKALGPNLNVYYVDHAASKCRRCQSDWSHSSTESTLTLCWVGWVSIRWWQVKRSPWIMECRNY